MEELLYSALDLAAIISSMDLGCREQANFLEQVWENERAFLRSGYRDNKRQMILDTSYWLTYFSDKPTIDAEFPTILKGRAGGRRRTPDRELYKRLCRLGLVFQKHSVENPLWGRQGLYPAQATYFDEMLWV